MSIYRDPDGEYAIDVSKPLKVEDVFPKGFDPKKFTVMVEYDLSEETDEDIRYDLVEETVDNLRELIYEKIKGMPRGEQLNDKLEKIYDVVKNC